MGVLNLRHFLGVWIIGTQQREQVRFRESSEISFSGKDSAHAADGILNATFLPRCMGITEKSFHGQSM